MSRCIHAPRRATRSLTTRSGSARRSTISAARLRTPASSSRSGCARRAAGMSRRPPGGARRPASARVDYEQHGRTYTRHLRADPRIASRIHAALGDAHTVLNVGAGTGSYEPRDRWVLAVEPSATMRAQRPPGAAPAIAARAEALPLDENSVDAAMACVTIHHW